MGFSEKLKAARKRANLTQKELSEKSGVSQQAISVIEKGERSPSEVTMRMLAEALGCTIGDLTESEDPREESPTLTVDEKKLIQDYRSLNQQGKEYIRQTMYMACNIYRQRADLPVVEERTI